ncbi:MAG: molybdenum cofactor guanylyltransferase, partial [Candidatus Methylomirabilales bacterium]
DLIAFMKGEVEGYDVVIPKAQGELHPLHAIYSKRCLPFMKELIDRDRLKIVAFFPQVRVKVLEEETIRRFDQSLLSLFNANTPEELALARRLSKGSFQPSASG